MTDRFVIELPWRTLLLNEFLGQHWTKRQRYAQQLAAEIAVAIPFHKRPATPWARWSILIERESPRDCDPGAIWGGAKPIPDILQPFSKRCPRGIGVVLEDNSKSLVAYKCQHIHGPRKWTRITVINESGERRED